MKDFAQNYRRRFGAIVPVKAWGTEPADYKTPLIRNWSVNPLTTDFEVECAWSRDSNANIGLPTGKISGGILVIDFDDKTETTGIRGIDSLRDWEKTTGKHLPDETWISLSGGGGTHYFYHTNHEIRGFSCSELAVDVRCDGSYILLPPSLHYSGKRYAWEQHPSEYELQEADDSVFEFIAYLKSKTQATRKMCSSGKELFQLPDEVQQGERVSTMVRLAAVLTSIGLSDINVEEAIRNENYYRCRPPLEDKELQKQVFPAIQRFKKRREMEGTWSNWGFHNTQQKNLSQKQRIDLLQKLKKQVQEN